MAEITRQDLEDLALMLKIAIQNEFSIKRMSGNLADTVQISVQDDQKVIVEIPGQTYNMLEYQQNKVIIHTSHGSYASKLDEEGSSFFIYPNNSRKGSFRISPRNHIGYLDRVINKALDMWLIMKANKYELVRREEI